MKPETIFPIFMSVWVVLMIVSVIVFFVGKNSKLKRKLWAPFVIGTGLLFLGFVYLMGKGHTLYLMVPAVAMISFLNIRSTKFCDSCGKTNINRNLLFTAEYCSKCGERI